MLMDLTIKQRSWRITKRLVELSSKDFTNIFDPKFPSIP